MARAEVLALIPARGGSKGIPRKNLVRLAGRPLLAFSVEHALAVPAITRTIVSTDDDEIAGVAREHGAEVPFRRPAAFASDAAPDIDVFRHALEWLRDRDGYRPDLVVHLRPTNPLRRVPVTAAAVREMLEHPEADALRSVSVASQSPYKMWRVEDETMTPMVRVEGLDEAHSLPRQSLPLAYWQNGVVDVVRPRTVLELGSMVGRTIRAFVVDEPVYELDYPEQIPQLERLLVEGEREGGGHRDARVAPRHPV